MQVSDWWRLAEMGWAGRGELCNQPQNRHTSDTRRGDSQENGEDHRGKLDLDEYYILSAISSIVTIQSSTIF